MLFLSAVLFFFILVLFIGLKGPDRRASNCPLSAAYRRRYLFYTRG